MKQAFHKMYPFVILGLVLSCKKTEINTSQALPPGTDKELIDRARVFFTKEVGNHKFEISNPQNERQKLKKTPLWERAVVRTGSKGEVVAVPLEYEKNLAFSHEEKNRK